jgi:putative membrane protein
MWIHNQKMDLLVGSLLLRPYVFFFLAAFLVAGHRDLGLRRTLLFGAVIWPIAWLAELCSTRVGVPFGLYHYTGITRGQEVYVADIPFFSPLSFTFLAYAAFCLARFALAGRHASAPALALLAGFLMMMLDVVIDPLAVRGDRWFLGRIFYYPDGGVYFGVPLSNFAGWWVVGATSIGMYLLSHRLSEDRSPGHLSQATHARNRPPTLRYKVRGGRVGAGIALYYSVLGFNLAVTAWIGEWRLLATGFVLHALMALAVGACAGLGPLRSAIGTRGVPRA